MEIILKYICVLLCWYSLTIDAVEAVEETYSGNSPKPSKSTKISKTSKKPKTSKELKISETPEIKKEKHDSSSDNSKSVVPTKEKEKENKEESTAVVNDGQHLAPDQLNVSTLSAASSIDNLEEG